MDTSNIVKELKCLLIFTLHTNGWEVYDSSRPGSTHLRSGRAHDRRQFIRYYSYVCIRRWLNGLSAIMVRRR